MSLEVLRARSMCTIQQAVAIATKTVCAICGSPKTFGAVKTTTFIVCGLSVMTENKNCTGVEMCKRASERYEETSNPFIRYCATITKKQEEKRSQMREKKEKRRKV